MNVKQIMGLNQAIRWRLFRRLIDASNRQSWSQQKWRSMHARFDRVLTRRGICPITSN